MQPVATQPHTANVRVAAIQEAAYKTLYTLMSQRPDQRAQIAAALADFAFSIADKQHELIYVVLHKLALLLKEWELCVAKEEVKEPTKALPLNIVMYAAPLPLTNRSPPATQ